MVKSSFTIKPHLPFHFKDTIYSHGWAALLPNYYDKNSGLYQRIERLNTGSVVKLEISGNNDYKNPLINVIIYSTQLLTKPEKTEVKAKVNYMLRTEEDLGAFYKLCKSKGNGWEKIALGKGRLLRSSSLFEDFVKVICTTNVQWGGTKGMVQRLVEFYGDPFPEDKLGKAFPTPEKIAKLKFDSFHEKARLGYRSEYIHLLANQIVKGEIVLSEMEDKSISTPELKKRLQKIKGIGPYAAASMLMILERYDDIAVDTVFRDFMKKKYYKGKYPTDKEALKHYDEWKEWKFLAYWFDVWQFHNESV